jgi:hypothetical protein
LKSLLLFAYVSIFSAFIPLGAGLFQWRQLEGNLKWIVWLGVTSLISDGVSFLLIDQHVTTWPLLNLFYTVQLVILFSVLHHQRKIMVPQIALYGCVIFSIVNFLFIQTPTTFNTYTAYAGGILMITLSISYLYALMNDLAAERVYNIPGFWLAFGVLVYYGGTLFLFLFNNYLVARLPESHQLIWVLHNALNITKNIFLFAALWVHYKSKTSPL